MPWLWGKYRLLTEQKEAATLSRDGRSLYLASEQLPAPMYRLDLPD